VLREVDLWVVTAEVVLRRGRTFVEAVATADRVMVAYLRNNENRIGMVAGRETASGPGLATCSDASSLMLESDATDRGQRR